MVLLATAAPSIPVSCANSAPLVFSASVDRTYFTDESGYGYSGLQVLHGRRRAALAAAASTNSTRFTGLIRVA